MLRQKPEPKTNQHKRLLEIARQHEYDEEDGYDDKLGENREGEAASSNKG